METDFSLSAMHARVEQKIAQRRYLESKKSVVEFVKASDAYIARKEEGFLDA